MLPESAKQSVISTSAQSAEKMILAIVHGSSNANCTEAESRSSAPKVLERSSRNRLAGKGQEDKERITFWKGSKRDHRSQPAASIFKCTCHHLRLDHINEGQFGTTNPSGLLQSARRAEPRTQHRHHEMRQQDFAYMKPPPTSSHRCAWPPQTWHTSRR